MPAAMTVIWERMIILMITVSYFVSFYYRKDGVGPEILFCIMEIACIADPPPWGGDINTCKLNITFPGLPSRGGENNFQFEFTFMTALGNPRQEGMKQSS